MAMASLIVLGIGFVGVIVGCVFLVFIFSKSFAFTQIIAQSGGAFVLADLSLCFLHV